MRWAIEVLRTQLERRNLADLLSRLGFTTVDKTPHIAFTSAAIDRCSTAGEVIEIGRRVRDRFTGPAKIDPDFQLGAVVDCSVEPQQRHYFLEIQEAIHLHSTFHAATLTLNAKSDLTEEQRRSWETERIEAEYQQKLTAQLSRLEPAYFNPKAEKVLELLAVEKPTGTVLLKIYELMRGPSSNREAFGRQFNITNEEYRRFGAVVNHDSESGDWARHAHGEPSTTPNPMSKSEAEAFVRRIAADWLRHVRVSRSG